MKTIAFIQRGALTFPSAPSRTCSQGTGLNLLGAPFNSLSTWLKPQLLGLPGSPAPVPHSTGSGVGSQEGGTAFPRPLHYPPTHSAGSSAVLSPWSPSTLHTSGRPSHTHIPTHMFICTHVRRQYSYTHTYMLVYLPTHSTCSHLPVHTTQEGGPPGPPLDGEVCCREGLRLLSSPPFPRVPPSFLVTTV